MIWFLLVIFEIRADSYEFFTHILQSVSTDTGAVIEYMIAQVLME